MDYIRPAADIKMGKRLISKEKYDTSLIIAEKL
jgi:hypothetical protein